MLSPAVAWKPHHCWLSAACPCHGLEPQVVGLTEPERAVSNLCTPLQVLLAKLEALTGTEAAAQSMQQYQEMYRWVGGSRDHNVLHYTETNFGRVAAIPDGVQPSVQLLPHAGIWACLPAHHLACRTGHAPHPCRMREEQAASGSSGAATAAQQQPASKKQKSTAAAWKSGVGYGHRWGLRHGLFHLAACKLESAGYRACDDQPRASNMSKTHHPTQPHLLCVRPWTISCRGVDGSAVWDAKKAEAVQVGA